MKRRIFLMATAATALLLLAAPVFAQQMPETGPRGMTKDQMLEDRNNDMSLLGVPSEKREGIRAIQSEYRDKLFRLRQDIYAKGAALNASMLKPLPDPIAAKAISREIATLRVEEMDILIEMHTRIARETGVRMPMGTGAGRMMMN